MTDCWSLGSNYHPSTQSRKISIGVMIDSSSKKKSEANKNVENARPRTNLPNSTIENNLAANDNVNGIAPTDKRKSAEDPGPVNSPWRSPRASNRKLGTLDAVLSKQTSSLSGSKGIQKKNLNENQTSKFQSRDGKQNIDGDERRKNGSPERAGPGLFTFPTAQEAIAPDKEVVGGKQDNRENRSIEALRTKLCEILGTVSSPASHHSTSRAPAQGIKVLKVGTKVDLKGNTPAKSREFSDTIETDSESPNIATRRPVTRPLLKKRVPVKGNKKAKYGAPKNNKNKKQGKNTFTFEEATHENVNGVVTFTSEPKKRKPQRKSAAIERRKIHFPENDDADEIQRETYRKESAAPAEKVQNRKTSSFFSTRGSSHSSPSKSRSCFLKPQKNNQEDSHQSQGTRRHNKPGVLDGVGSSDKGKNQQEFVISNPFMEKDANPQDDFQSPTLRYRTPVSSPSPCLTPENGLDSSEKKGKQKLTNPFKKNTADIEADFQSPTFGFRTPISSSSPCFTPEIGPVHQGDVSPGLEETRPSQRNIFSFNGHRTPKAAYHAPNAERENLTKNLGENSSRGETSATTNEDSDGLSESSSDEGNSDRSKEDSPLMEHLDDFREVNTSPPETYSRYKFKFQPSVRTTDPDVTRDCEKSPTISSPTGTHESDCFKEPTGLDEEDGLGRAVTLFAMAIHNLERKLKSAARKRSSEILHSASEGISLQLQNVESHILTDVGNLTSFSKTKRKHMETRFTEQQERLKSIREKFENEINDHFKDFESTLDSLEANRIELKGTMKKQKASHQKLITQMERDVETQLRDAERRITNVNQTARQKMHQLKRIVAECFKDGMMG